MLKLRKPELMGKILILGTGIFLLGATITQLDWITQVKNKPVQDIREGNFRVQTPGGSLAGGSPTTIILRPCPLGVNGTDIGHYLLIPGSGAEAVLITGGSCSSLQASGTILFTPQNSHSSGWQIQSASSGLAEIWAQGLNAQAPPGTYDIWAPLTPPASASLRCDGVPTIEGIGTPVAQTIFNYHSSTGDMFHVVHNGFSAEGCLCQQIGTPSASNGIGIYGNLSTAPVHEANLGQLNNMIFSGFTHGISTDGGTGLWELRADISFASVGDGISWGDTQGHLIGVITEFSQTGNGITFHLPSSGNEEPVPWLEGFQAFGNYGWGAFANEASFHFSGLRNYFGNDRLGEFYYNYHFSSECDNCTFAQAGVAPGLPAVQWGIFNTAPGVFVDSNGAGLTLHGPRFGGIRGTCFKEAGNQSQLQGMLTGGGQDGCGLGGVTGNIYALDLQSADSNHGILDQVTDGQFNGPVRLAGNGKMFRGNQIQFNSPTTPALEIVSGVQNIVNDNYIFNSIGVAFQCGSGTLAWGTNTIGAGIVINGCQGQVSTPMVGVPFKPLTVATLPIAGQNAFTAFWATDGTPGSTPAVGGGAGCFAFSDGVQYHCK